jgi:hypothetical protein
MFFVIPAVELVLARGRHVENHGIQKISFQDVRIGRRRDLFADMLRQVAFHLDDRFVSRFRCPHFGGHGAGLENGQMSAE